MDKAYTVENTDYRIKFRPGTGEQYIEHRFYATTAKGRPFVAMIEEANLDQADELLTKKAQALDAIK